MDVTFDLILQALPLVASGLTALIVFVKKGVMTDVDVTELKEDIKEIKKDIKEMNEKLGKHAVAIAVLKSKDVWETSSNDN